MKPEEIEGKDFLVTLRGYDRAEVDDYLKTLAVQIRDLHRQLGERAAVTSAAQAPTLPSVEKEFRQVGADTSKILLAAREVAEDILSKARAEGAQRLAEVRAQAEKERRDSVRMRGEAEDDLRRLRELRNTLTTQLEDVGRRLDEQIARLSTDLESAERTPVDETRTVVGAPDSASVLQEPHIDVEVAKPIKPASAFASPEAETSVQEAAAEKVTHETDGRAASVEPAPPPAEEEPPALENPTRLPPLAEEVPAPDSLEGLLLQIRQASEASSSEVAEAIASIATPISGPSVPSQPQPEPKPTQQAPISDAPSVAASNGMLARRAEVLGDIPDQAARRLKRLLQEDQNDGLDRIRTANGKGPAENCAVPEQEQVSRFKEGLDEGLRRAFASGRKVGGASDEGDASYLVESLVGRQLVAPLRAEITKSLTTGLEAGESPNSLGERVNDVFRVWKGVRTQMLGEGMIHSAFHHGLMDAWKSTGIQTKRWVRSEDELECPRDVCKTNEEAGSVTVDGTFPSGHHAPPAHGGCDCTLSAD